MAKSFRNGVMILDAAGQGFNGRNAESYATNPDGTYVTNPAVNVATTQVRAQTITVHPSGAWVCILKDQAGNVVFSANGSTSDANNFYGPFDFNGVVADTMTNVTRVILSPCESVQW